MTIRHLALRAALLVALSACAPTEPGVPTADVAVIEGGLAIGPVVEAPATVAANTEFGVIVRTLGSPCTRPGGASVSYDGNVAIVTPVDAMAHPGDEVCTLVGFPVERTVRLRFQAAGSATIRVRGRDAGSNRWATVDLALAVTP